MRVKMRGWPKKREKFEERVWGERKCIIKKMNSPILFFFFFAFEI